MVKVCAGCGGEARKKMRFHSFNRYLCATCAFLTLAKRYKRTRKEGYIGVW